MDDFRCLLERFWVTKAENKELYFAVRRAQSQYQRFVNEQLGWNLIVNESVVKLEKVPPKAMPWMGIQEFQETMDYCVLCGVLLFLADLDDGEQFLLSTLTRALEALLADVCPVDWTRFPHRKSLVRVLRYVQQIGILLVYDGDSDDFGSNQNQEVLYESTGLSHHFPVHFGWDILHCNSAEDFEAFSWEGANAEHGLQRTRRVYRQLVLSPACYWSEVNRGDYEYIKSQRQSLSRHLGEMLGGELHVHKNGAFWVLDDDSRFGLVHPRELALSDVTLLFCAQLRERISQEIYPRGEDDMVILTRREFQHELLQCRAQCGNGWGHRLRELSPDKLCQEVISYMSGWMLLEEREDSVILCPAVGKLIGQYPKNYRGEEGGVADESLENV